VRRSKTSATSQSEDIWSIPGGIGKPASNRALARLCPTTPGENAVSQDLVRFLTETAHETAARARAASDAVRAELTAEVEELMALRVRILGRYQAAEKANQLVLPLADAA